MLSAYLFPRVRLRGSRSEYTAEVTKRVLELRQSMPTATPTSRRVQTTCVLRSRTTSTMPSGKETAKQRWKGWAIVEERRQITATNNPINLKIDESNIIDGTRRRSRPLSTPKPSLKRRWDTTTEGRNVKKAKTAALYAVSCPVTLYLIICDRLNY
jgi:hypothetical protein